MSIGVDGYLSKAKTLMDTTVKLKEGVCQIDVSTPITAFFRAYITDI